ERRKIRRREEQSARAEARAPRVVGRSADREKRAQRQSEYQAQEPEAPERRLAQYDSERFATDRLRERQPAHAGSLRAEPDRSRDDPDGEAPDRDQQEPPVERVWVRGSCAAGDAPRRPRYDEHEYQPAEQQHRRSEMKRPCSGERGHPGTTRA